MMNDLISRKAAIETLALNTDYQTPEGIRNDLINHPGKECDWLGGIDEAISIIEELPSVPVVPLDKLCELLAEMYHCPSSGWPSSGRVCHPGCPDEAFEKLCGTDCENYSDAERWKAFLTKWMEESNATD